MAALDFLARNHGYSSYNAYLKSDHWRLFKKKNRKTNCFCCGLFNVTRKKLQLHHITYDHFAREMPQDVITVCDDCHVLIHKQTKEGHDLATAHFSVRKSRWKKFESSSSSGKNNKWVFWLECLNKSKHETADQLAKYLQSKGLMNENRTATEKAYRLGFARLIEEKDRWNIRQYLFMMKGDKRVLKSIKQNRPISPMQWKIANFGTHKIKKRQSDYLRDCPELNKELRDVQNKFLKQSKTTTQLPVATNPKIV